MREVIAKHPSQQLPYGTIKKKGVGGGKKHYYSDKRLVVEGLNLDICYNMDETQKYIKRIVFK